MGLDEEKMKQEQQGSVNLNRPPAIQTEMLAEMLVEPLEFDVVFVRAGELKQLVCETAGQIG